MNPPPGLGGVPQQQPQQLIPPTPQTAATAVQHQPSMQELLLFNQMNQMALMGTLTPMQQMQLMMTIMGNQAQNNFVNMNQFGQAQAGMMSGGLNSGLPPTISQRSQQQE